MDGYLCILQKLLKLTKTHKCVFLSRIYISFNQDVPFVKLFGTESRLALRIKKYAPLDIDAVALLPRRSEAPYHENFHTFCAQE